MAGTKSLIREIPEHRSYSMMKNRCTNPKAMDYRHYGGRGIKVCERWMKSYYSFIEDMGNRPSLKHTLDRIDVNGNYEPGNCRWATRQEQAYNKRNNTLVIYKGTPIVLAKLARAIGVPANTIRSRINQLGWSVEEAIHGKTDSSVTSNIY